MAANSVAICNMALGRIGHRQSIVALADATTEARACSRFYDDSLDFVLASHTWRFATRRAELTLLEDVERSGWLYAYEMPADCVADRYLWAGQRPDQTPVEGRIPYELEHDDDGDGRLVLLSDAEDVELVYTARITHVPLYPPHFVDALAWKLAGELALELSVKPPVAKMLLETGHVRLLQAVAVDLHKGQADVPQEPETIRVR